MLSDGRGHGHDHRPLYDLVQWSMTKDGQWKSHKSMVTMVMLKIYGCKLPFASTGNKKFQLERNFFWRSNEVWKVEEWLGEAVVTGKLSGIFKHNEFVKAMQQKLNCDEDSAIVGIINYGWCIWEIVRRKF